LNVRSPNDLLTLSDVICVGTDEVVT
jgi:hypothetical protein